MAEVCIFGSAVRRVLRNFTIDPRHLFWHSATVLDKQTYLPIRGVVVGQRKRSPDVARSMIKLYD